jgi:hypothetical protein
MAMFEPRALRDIARLEGWQPAFARRLAKVMPANAQAIIDEIPNVTNWQNGTGTLDSSFYVMESSPYNAVFGSDLSYAHRQNDGFKGTDSIGRVYDQEGAHYIEKAIDKAEPRVEEQTYGAAQATLEEITGG